MKIFTLFLTTLLAVSSVFSYAMKREENECEKEIKIFTDCRKLIETWTNSNFESNCELYNSKVCKDFFKNPNEITSSCEDEEKMKLDIQEDISMDFFKAQAKYYCSTDENNRACPIVQSILNGKGNDEDVLKVVKLEVCRSKKCIDAALEFEEYIIDNKEYKTNAKLSDNKKTSDEIKSMHKDYISFLKADNCTTLIGTQPAETLITSDANRATLSYGLVVSLGLLFFNFF
ncbi:hypothetical protein LY90DRAFT_702096 [Neocallimastix californiae]|jgi:hypothetical protein|uniref:Uncharacterized protein n=1 Tax=Neocallimastix californiae TaxID=1754190 RepID=A0A1Y2D7H0_9FUNG|nr:hypothetical protein LY90DRAFT_702096 [Neocallimastix californiae]|eukprot:ORY55223.1 hypothetical protein LY90DRAFT_702096 [Neocallimastix californiae]